MITKVTALALSLATVGLAGADASAAPRHRDYRDDKPNHARRVYRQRHNPAPTITAMTPSRGRVGTTVHLRGTHFEAGAKVKIGNVWITPTAVSRNRIVFTIPNHATDGTVSVVQRGDREVVAGSFDVVRRPARTRAAFLSSYEVRQENALHAERIADLDRMIAQAQGDYVLRGWLLNLKRSEEARHARTLETLRTSYYASL